MTRADVSKALFAWFNRYAITENNSGYALGVINAKAPTYPEKQQVLAAINGAFQEIAFHAPTGFFVQDRSSGRLGESTTLSVGVTQSSAAVTIASGYTARMLGCMILIGDDPRVNRIVSGSGGNYVLARPYAGTTNATAAATVRYDAWALQADEDEVAGPVRLQFIDTESAITRLEPFDGGHDEWLDQLSVRWQALTAGEVPTHYRIITRIGLTTENGASRYDTPLRLIVVNRWTSRPFVVDYRAKIDPPEWIIDDITTEGSGTRGAAQTGLPVGWDAGILLPIALWRLTAALVFPQSAVRSIESIRTGIFDDYQRALKLLANKIPQTERPGGGQILVA